jgi:hypothetical protein
MFLSQPTDNDVAEAACEPGKLVGINGCHPTHGFVFEHISLPATRLKILHIGRAVGPQNERYRLQSPVISPLTQAHRLCLQETAWVRRARG